MGEQSLVTLVPWTMVAQILNLLLQMYLFKRFLFKPVWAVLEKRQAACEQQLTDAAAAKAEAETMKAAYEADMAAAKTEAGEILQNATQTAAVRSENLLTEAKAEAAALKAKAAADIAQERKEAVNSMKDEISGIAMDIASKVVEREISADDHKDLIDEFIKNVGEAS